MKILITGGGGFIGAHTVQHFLEKTNWPIVVLDSFYSHHRGSRLRLKTIFSDNPQWEKRVKIIEHDLNWPIDNYLIAELGNIDAIINIASLSHVDSSISHPAPFIQNNVKLILNMLEYARLVKPKFFFHISTDEVYGPTVGNERHSEWHHLLPSNPYSASKAAQEDISIAYWRTYGVPLVITNTMNNIGEMQHAEKFVPKVINSVLENKTVTIHGNQKEIGSRFYLHARNHADAILFLLKKNVVEKFPDSPRPARFHIVGDKQLDNLELAQLIAKYVGRPLKYKLVDFNKTRPGHDPHYGLAGEKISKLGWKPPVPLLQSLQKTVEWTLAHPEWLKEH